MAIFPSRATWPETILARLSCVDGMEITATKPCTSPHSTTSRATDLNKRLMDLTSPEYIIVSWTKLIHERRGHIGTQRGGAYQDPIPTWVEEYYFKGNYKTARIPDGYGQVPQDFYFTVSCRCQLSDTAGSRSRPLAARFIA